MAEPAPFHFHTLPITRHCVGCEAPIVYVVNVPSSPREAPECSPPMGCVAFAGGHLCSPCAYFVFDALTARRSKPTCTIEQPCHDCNECTHRQRRIDRMGQ